MAAKKRFRMRGVKQTPKRLEEEILKKSGNLAENPGILRPMCAGNCRKCFFDAPFKNIEAISRHTDADVLLKLASRGSDDMAKAYAGTISLSAAGKIPMLATATIAGEKVPFAVRGSVGNDKLIGCQYYDDPKIRLLYYNSFIKKNKLHLYSFEDGLVCSNYPNMPEDYLYEAFWDAPYEFKDDSLDCGHRDALVLDIKIKSRDEHIYICENCAKYVSLIQYLISKICAVDPVDDIEVDVMHPYHSAEESGKEKIEGDLLKKYLRGELTDKMLLQTIKREKLDTLKQGNASAYIIGTKNYGSDIDTFLNAVAGPDSEKKTIKKFLEEKPVPVIIKNGKTSEVLTSLWDEHWKELITAHTSPAVADKYKEKPKCFHAQVLEEAYNTFISADVVASLPVFSKPRPMTKLSDALAKAAKVGGRDLVVSVITGESLKDTALRSLASAFVLACDPDGKLPLHLTGEERDFAEYLAPFAKMVIDSDGNKYRDTMNTLLTACGSGESV